MIIDVCTRFVMLKALKDKNQFTVAQSLLETFCTFGFPVILQSDNGTEFVNRVIKKMIEIARTEHRTITAYNPQANGVAERFIGTMANCILKLLKGNSASWEKTSTGSPILHEQQNHNSYRESTIYLIV